MRRIVLAGLGGFSCLELLVRPFLQINRQQQDDYPNRDAGISYIENWEIPKRDEIGHMPNRNPVDQVSYGAAKKQPLEHRPQPFGFGPALVDETDKADIKRVYLNLTKGSRNHFRAFAGALEILGESYETPYLSELEIDAILSTGWETGPF